MQDTPLVAFRMVAPSTPKLLQELLPLTDQKIIVVFNVEYLSKMYLRLLLPCSNLSAYYRDGQDRQHSRFGSQLPLIELECKLKVGKHEMQLTKPLNSAFQTFDMRFAMDTENPRLNLTSTLKASTVFQISLSVIFDEAFKQALSTEDKLKLDPLPDWLILLQLASKDQSKLTCNRTGKGQQKSLDAVTFK